MFKRNAQRLAPLLLAVLLAAAGMFRLPVASALGGLEAPPDLLWDVTEALSAGCGVTQFLQTQHLSAVALVSRTENEALRSESLPDLMNGRQLAGVAIAHLRRPKAVQVERVGDRVVFDGVAPWFTGWGAMDSVALAGTLPDGRYLYVLIPTAGLLASEPMRLCAMSAASTVSLDLRGLEVASDRILLVQTPEEMRQADAGRVLRHSAQPLGVVRAAVAILRARSEGSARAAADSFELQGDPLRALARQWSGDPPSAYRIRARANALAGRAAQAALVASGGAGNDLAHPAQRLVREAMFYTLTQLDAQLKDEALAVLAFP